MAKFNLQPHEARLIQKMEKISSVEIPKSDISIFIRVIRRHSHQADVFEAVEFETFRPYIENPELFNSSSNTFLFIQNGRYHRRFSTVDPESSYIIIQPNTIRETKIGHPICQLYFKK